MGHGNAPSRDVHTTMKDARKTKPQLVAEMESLREELRRHITAETDAARAEEAMWQTQVALLTLFNNLPGMAYRTTFSSKYPQGRVEFVSGGCLKLTGYPAGAYVTDTTLYRQKVVHPEDRERVVRAIAEAQARHQPFNLTYRILTKSGDVRWMDEHGTALYDAQGQFTAREGFITDVTERALHVEELRRQHSELQKLTRAVEQAGELILIGDASGTVQYVNQAFEELTGFSRADVVGRPLRMAAYDRRERDLFRRIRVTLQRGEVWRGRYVSRRKDGTLFELECTASPVCAPDGAYEGYVAVQRDSSAANHATFEDRLTQKLEVLGMIADSFIREFNNQLQAILGYGQLAAGSPADTAATEAHLKRILEAADRAREVSADFLAFLNCAEAEVRVLSFREVGAKAVRLLRTALPTSIEIQDALGSEPWPLNGNPTQLLMVIISLAVNAARPIWQTGGIVRLQLASGRGQPGTAGKDQAAPAAWVECRIASHTTGAGAAASLPPPAAQEPRLAHSSASGLAVVRDIVQQHGGSLSSSEEKPGERPAEFVLRLPLAAGAQIGRQGHRSPVVAASAPSGRRVMFVDDEAMLAELAQLELEGLGYSVRTYTASLDALEAFRTDPAGVDLVIADQTMPRMTGFELARQMLALRPDLPIILVTGYSEIVNDLQARAIGIRDYLIKPITPETLAEAIRRAMGSD